MDASDSSIFHPRLMELKELAKDLVSSFCVVHQSNHATAVYMYMYLHFFQLDARFKKTFYRDSLRVQKKKSWDLWLWLGSIDTCARTSINAGLRNYHYPILIYCCNQVNDSSSMIIKWKMFMEKIYLYSEKELQNSVCMHVQLIFFNVWIGFLPSYYCTCGILVKNMIYRRQCTQKSPRHIWILEKKIIINCFLKNYLKFFSD